jgi:hypothetical protein
VTEDPDGRAVEINQRGHCPARDQPNPFAKDPPPPASPFKPATFAEITSLKRYEIEICAVPIAKNVSDAC